MYEAGNELGCTTEQKIVIGVKLVIVVSEVKKRDKPFTFVIIQLHVQYPFGDTGYDTVEYLSQFIFHKLDLLVLDGRTFGI